MKTIPGGIVFKLVAGPGFAPGPTGYEPVEVLLLHPAILYLPIISTNF